MPAIFTNRLKKQLLDTVYDDLTNVTNRYYVGVGRSEQWDSSDTVVSPSNSYREERNFRLAMQSVKQVADVSYVIPRYNWTSGTIYQGWDDNLSGTPSNAYYVLTEDNQIYVCLQQGRTAAGTTVTSTVKPTGTGTKPFRTSDGYVWKYMYSLSGERTSKYLSGNFIPVQFITDSSGSPALNTVEVLQAQVQEAASAGQLLGVRVTTGGTGYTSAPTVTVQGNGTGASATAFVAGGAVVKIELDSSTDSGMTMGHSYDYASISFTGGGGTGANARVILAQDSGFGYNPINDLRSSSLMFNTKPSGAEGSE